MRSFRDSVDFKARTGNSWKDSRSAHDCILCKNKFGVLKRKHHCRQCGEVICMNCSVINSKNVRLCSICSEVKPKYNEEVSEVDTVPIPSHRLSTGFVWKPGTELENWKDSNLPNPPNIRSCNTAQLAYMHNKCGILQENKVIIIDIANEMISQLANAPVCNQNQLTDVIPLATVHNEQVIKNLLRVLIEKVNNEVFIDERLLQAISLVIYYAPKQMLKVNDMLVCLEIIAVKLCQMKSGESVVVLQGLRSMNALLDAVMTLKVVDIDKAKVEAVSTSLNGLTVTCPLREVALAYAQKALLKITKQPSDYEAGLAASYQIVKGVISLGFAIVDKSPFDIIDSVLTIYSAGQEIGGLVNISNQFPWFEHVRVLKVLAPHDYTKFTSYLSGLSDMCGKQGKRFSRPTVFPKELSISLIDILDGLIRDKDKVSCVEENVRGTVRYMPIRESAIRLLEQVYINTAVYGKDSGVRLLVLQKLYQYCSIGEIELQRVAKEISQNIFLYRDAKETGSTIVSLFRIQDHIPSQFWSNETVILSQPVDINFMYIDKPTALGTVWLSQAFEARYNMLYLIEGMRQREWDLSETLLKDDLATYIPVNGSLGATSKIIFDLYTQTDAFLKGSSGDVLLIHGNAGSGKSLFGHYLQLRLWEKYSHGDGAIPVFINLAGLKDPYRDAINQTFKEAGFSNGKIIQLKRSGKAFLFILDGFDEIQTKGNLYNR